MGVIFSNSFVNVADSQITASSETTGYPKINVMDRWHLKRRFRAGDLNKSDTSFLLKFDLGIAQTVAAVFLNDINFDKVRIRGDATDLGTDWSLAAFDSGEISISEDEIVGRYKVYVPLSSFAYRWMVIQVPTTASPVGSYRTFWEVGTVCILSSVLELSRNIAINYSRTADLPYTNIEIAGRSIERVALNPNLKWKGTIDTGARYLSEESDLWQLNRMSLGGELVFYENNGDTSKVYLCARNTAYKGSYLSTKVVKGNVIELEELV